MPAASSRACATGPTPQIRPTGSGARNSRTASAGTSTRPSGLATSLAIFATSFTGAMPTEQASPVSARTSARNRSARARGGPNSRSVPVTSRKASSSERPSTSGVKRRKISKMRADSRVYFAISPARKTPSGQRRRASAVGCAECTPKRRAS